MSLYSKLQIKDFSSYIIINASNFTERLKEILYFNIRAMNISLSYSNELFITCQIKDFFQVLEKFDIIKYWSDK